MVSDLLESHSLRVLELVLMSRAAGENAGRVPSSSEKFQHQRGTDGTAIYGGGMRGPLAHLKPFLKPPES